MWCAQRRGDDIFLKASVYVRLQKPGSAAEKKMQVLRLAAATSFFWRLIWMLKSTVFISLSQWMRIITAEAIVSLWKLHSSAGTETFQMSWKQWNADGTFVAFWGRLSPWCHNRMAFPAHTKHAIQFIRGNKQEDPLIRGVVTLSRGVSVPDYLQLLLALLLCTIICSFVSFFILSHSWLMHAFWLFKFSLLSH